MYKTARRLSTLATTLCCTALLASCCPTGHTLPSPRPYTGTVEQHYHMLKELNKEGVGVTEFGSTLTLILPTQKFFRGTTTDIREPYKATLRRIARLVKTYTESPITVSGHTDKVATTDMQRKNSFYHAQAVAAYLWNHDIPMQHIKVVPEGSYDNVSNTKNPEGAYDNRRVEIHMGLKPTVATEISQTNDA